MRGCFLLLALGVLLALAVVPWMRASPGAAVPEPASRPAASTAPDLPPQLAQPRPDKRRVDRGLVESAAPPAPAATASPSTWTGVRVRVVAEENGQPVARVRVRARNDGEKQSWKEVDRPHGQVNEEPITGADGVAEIELAAGAPYEIHLRHDGEHVLAARKNLEPALIALEVRDLVIPLRTKPDVRLYGRVLDRETNAPIPGARVGRSKRWNTIDATDTEGEQRTDADGQFQFAGESWRRAVVSVLATGYEVACVPIVSGHETPETALEITISRVATVRVTVIGATGERMPDVRPTLLTAMYCFGRPDGMAMINQGWTGVAEFFAKTDANGVALITDLPPRMPLEGVLYRGREELLRVSDPLTLSTGETREVEWPMGSASTIHGIALEVDGRPVADLPVCLEAARMPRKGYFEPIT